MPDKHWRTEPSVTSTGCAATYRWTDWLEGNAVYNWAILLDGQLVGLWKRTITRNDMKIEARLHESLDPGQEAALNAAAEAYGRFLGLPVEVSVDKDV